MASYVREANVEWQRLTTRNITLSLPPGMLKHYLHDVPSVWRDCPIYPATCTRSSDLFFDELTQGIVEFALQAWQDYCAAPGNTAQGLANTAVAKTNPDGKPGKSARELTPNGSSEEEGSPRQLTVFQQREHLQPHNPGKRPYNTYLERSPTPPPNPKHWTIEGQIQRKALKQEALPESTETAHSHFTDNAKSAAVAKVLEWDPPQPPSTPETFSQLMARNPQAPEPTTFAELQALMEKDGI